MNSTKDNPYFDNNIFSALIPVLVQCFGLILIGFLAGKFKILTDAQARGLGVYVTTFALPAIFFTVMVTIDFTGVDWYVVLAVSLGKLVVFFITMGIVLVVSRGRHIGLAGLLAIFTSQSNDVALAYPVLRLLYPDLATYIYLFAPAQLVILNPFAYFALEWHRAREKAAVTSVTGTIVEPSSPRRSCKKILNVIRHVITNPLFLMTVIGVIFNFILKHKLPVIVEGFFKDLGASFGATALFYLGFSMVGRFNAIDRRGLYILVFILIGKVLVSPFITREIAVLLLRHQPLNSSVPKSSFAFLYAAAPSAPPVFLFASKFGILPEVIGAGLVIGTFLYAPIMFVFAGMATLVSVDPGLYDSTLEKAAIYLSWASLLCCLWTLIILLVTKKGMRMPHRFTICLIISVMTFCVSIAIGSIWEPWSWDPIVGATWGQYIKFTVFFVSCTASRLWTAFIALALVLQARLGRPLSNREQSIFYSVGIIFPIVITAALLLTTHNTSVRDINPAFHYGRTQQFFSMVILVGCLSICLVSLFLIFRSRSLFRHSRRRFWQPLVPSTEAITAMTGDSDDASGSPGSVGQVTQSLERSPLIPDSPQDLRVDRGEPKKVGGLTSRSTNLDGPMKYPSRGKSSRPLKTRSQITDLDGSTKHPSKGTSSRPLKMRSQITNLDGSTKHPSKGTEPWDFIVDSSGQPHSADGPMAPNHVEIIDSGVHDWNQSVNTTITAAQHVRFRQWSVNIGDPNLLLSTSLSSPAPTAPVSPETSERVALDLASPLDTTDSSAEQTLQDQSFHRLFLLLILLMISMFFGVCICLWRLVRETEAGVFVVVEFIDQAFNFGQGILIFAVYGIDTELIVNPVARWFLAIRYWATGSFSSRSLRLAGRIPDPEVEQFISTHLSPCMTEICAPLQLQDRTLDTVFDFIDFHRWIKLNGIRRGNHSRETSLALLFALESRNLTRRLGGDMATSTAALSQRRDVSNPLRRLQASPVLFQYMKSH